MGLLVIVTADLTMIEKNCKLHSFSISKPRWTGTVRYLNPCQCWGCSSQVV